MVVGVCRLHLSMPGNTSLKDKRRLLRPLMAELHHTYKVAAAEVDLQNVWDEAVIAFATVSNDRRATNSYIDRIVAAVGEMRDLSLLRHEFEITNY